MPMAQTLAFFLATNVDRYNHWMKLNPQDPRASEAEHTLETLCKNFLPHGSGVDMGCQIDHEHSTANRIVIAFGFHHMDEHGFYDGWTDHKCIITPDIRFGIEIKITGRDRNHIKDYLYDLFHHAITQQINYHYVDGDAFFTNDHNIIATV